MKLLQKRTCALILALLFAAMFALTACQPLLPVSASPAAASGSAAQAPSPAVCQTPSATPSAVQNADAAGVSLIPMVKSYEAAGGRFLLTQTASVCVMGGTEQETEALLGAGAYLAQKLRASTGYALQVKEAGSPAAGDLFLTTRGGGAEQGGEGYSIEVTKRNIAVTAYTPEGVFRGIQTVRQLFPARIEAGSVQTGAEWAAPCASIADAPTYAWRGMMLDVARHFIGVEDVERVIDLMAGFKMNRFHLHLTDDQGWRIDIKSHPELTETGAKTAVGGGAGGFFTQEQYREIVAYAAERYITVVPEIDMPGHVNAALASVAELNPNGKRAKPNTGIAVGFSGLMCRSEVTYAFVDDVIKEVAALTPGEYLHIGGDEANGTSGADYSYFMTRVNAIAASYGKKTVGWSPFDSAQGVGAGSILQFWGADASQAYAKGMKCVVSPPDRAYLDMKYNAGTRIGLKWAGYVSTGASYDWDPADYVPQDMVLGVECPLWTETVRTLEDIEYLAFPRLMSHAEIGWTDKGQRSWDEYKERLAAFAPRLDAQGVGYYRDPAVPWK